MGEDGGYPLIFLSLYKGSRGTREGGGEKGLVEGAKGDSGRNWVEVWETYGWGRNYIKKDKGFRRDPFTCSFLRSPSVCIDLRGREDRSAKEGVGETHGRDTKRGRDLGFK